MKCRAAVVYLSTRTFYRQLTSLINCRQVNHVSQHFVLESATGWSFAGQSFRIPTPNTLFSYFTIFMQQSRSVLAFAVQPKCVYLSDLHCSEHHFLLVLKFLGHDVECGSQLGSVRKIQYMYLLEMIGQDFVNETRKKRHKWYDLIAFWQVGVAFSAIYRAPKKCMYVVARNFFLLLLTCSAWPCLGPA